MILYLLICISLSLSGIVGLLLMYMLYLDRLDKVRKNHIRELEKKLRQMTSELAEANQRRHSESHPFGTTTDEGIWVDVLDEA